MNRKHAIISILILAAAPAVAGIISPRASIAAESPATRSGAPLSAYIMAEEGADPWEDLRQLGVSIDLVCGRMATARLTADLITAAADVEGVAYIQTATPVEQMLDIAREETGLPDCWSTATPENPDGFDGRGVVVGVIDAGFDYTHESFRDAEGKSRIERVWEQWAEPQDGFASPEKFGYGIEISDPEALRVAEADVTGNSHGTHVASIAAGSSRFKSGIYRGVAPAARIVLVSLGQSSRDNVNLTNAISYVFDYAESLGLPCVINLSLGNHAGPHDGTTPFDLMADELCGEGRILVGSAGNHGADRFHVEATRTEGDLSLLRTFVDFRTAPSAHNTGGEVDIWLSPEMDAKVQLVCWSNSKKTVTGTLDIDLSTSSQTRSVEFESDIKGPITFSVERNPLNGKLHVLISSGITSVRSRHELGIVVTPLTAGHIDIWADNTTLGLTGNGEEGWSEPCGSTIAEIGGTGRSMISVGAYTTRNVFTPQGSTTEVTLPETLGELCSFSSYGPTADGRLKPEVTAPGCFIASSMSCHDYSGAMPVADKHEVPVDRDFSYGYMQGTSMAAPFVTGTVALWLQQDPKLTPERVREVVKTSSRNDSGESDDRHGYGKISPKGGLDLIIMQTGADSVIADGTSAGFRAQSGRGWLAIQADAAERLRVSRADGSGVAVAEGSVRLELPAGIYIVSGRSGAVKVIVR